MRTFENELDRETVETAAGTYTVVWVYDDSPDQPEDEGFVLIANVSGGRGIDIDTAPRSKTVTRADGTPVDQPLYRVKNDPISDAREVVAMNARIGYGEHYSGDYRSGAALVRYLTLKGCKGVTLVDGSYRPMDASSDRFARFSGVAWAPDDATYPNKYVGGQLAEWRAWADGDVFGWVVIGPDGEKVESIHWGYYNFSDMRAYTLEEAHAVIDDDAQERTETANLVGAGIVGLI